MTCSLDTPILNDIRHELRLILRRPWQPLLIVLIMAIGVGVGSAIYSMGDDLLLQPLPFDPGDRLVAVQTIMLPSGSLYMDSEQGLHDLGQQSNTLAGAAAYQLAMGTMTANGVPEFAEGMKVDSHFFPLIGISPALGRSFTANDDEYGAPGTMILSYACWQRRFAGDPATLGKEVLLDRRLYTVIGVMPRSFYFPFLQLSTTEDFWIPLQMRPMARRGNYDKQGIARVKTGATLPQAQAEAALIAHRIGKTEQRDFTFHLRSYRETIIEGYRPVLFLLAAVILCVQLLVCVNLASLLLVEALRHSKEVEIRFALGGTRWKIARLFLLRAGVLTLTGGTVGAGLAFGLVLLTRRLLLPLGLPGASQIGLNTTLLWVVLLVSLGTGIFFGVWPALAVTRKLHMYSLAQASQTTQPSAAQSLRKSRKSFVILQLVFSSAFLVVAGLFGMSMYRLMTVDLGFQLDHRLFVEINPSASARTKNADALKQFYSHIRQQLLALPGADAVTVSSAAPLNGYVARDFRIQDATTPKNPMEWTAGTETVDANYFGVLGMAVRNGRSFTDEDRQGASPVAIVNEAFAKRFFGNVSPLRKRICINSAGCPWREIVGVVSDARGQIDKPPEPTCYVPFWQAQPGFLSGATFIVHTRIPPSPLVRSIGEKMRTWFPGEGTFGPITLEEWRSMHLMGSRYSFWLVAAVAILALSLAALGVYGVIAGDVEQRRREIGIRMTLGATPNHIAALFQRQMLFMLVPGLLIGLALAAALMRYAGSMLYGVATTNLLAYSSAALVLSSVAAISTALPVRRALRESPADVLRAE